MTSSPVQQQHPSYSLQTGGLMLGLMSETAGSCWVTWDPQEADTEVGFQVQEVYSGGRGKVCGW